VKKETALKKAAAKKNNATAVKTDAAGHAIIDSAASLKEAGELLLKAIQLLPDNNPSLAAAADALINARSFLIHAAQMLTEAGEIMTRADKSMPSATERLKALKYTLN